MVEARNGLGTGANSLTWPMPSVAGNPLFAVVTDMNGKLLESVARVQKEWAEFVHRRVKEDIAASQQLMNCQTLADVQQVYSQYFRTAFEQYREQSERAVQRGKAVTEELAQAMEPRAGR
jgi:cation transport regulator ChaB